ncbi:MAG: lipopolysaccharide biosynthesis protein [Polyangiaceae bacterium]|nr:lipopolysaccharide biosynthesis protein [Polyangiaceae bacterium]
MASPTDQAGEARRLGRGGVAIAAAKLYFIAIGFVQQVLLKHALGLQDYGAYGRVQNVGNIVSSPIVATSVQGVSRVVAAAAPGEQAAIARRVLGYHFLAIVPIGIAFFFAAPLITTLLNAEHLETPVRIMTGVIVLYGLYTPLVGVLNGLRRFGAQAALDATFATLRTAGLVGGAFALRSSGRGVEGAFWGFVGAAAVITALAAPVLRLVRTTLRTDRPRAWQHLKFVAPLLGGQLALALLLQADNTLLGRFAADAAGALGQSEDTADTLAGAYRAAQLFCNLPYQLLLSVTFVLFPLLASAKAQGDAAGIARYVRTGVRLGLVVAGAMVSVVAGVAAPLLRVVFGADTAELAGEPMFVLALGLGAFAIFGILTTALTSLGGERESLLCTVAALGLVAGLCFVLVRGQPFGPGMLMRTALSTAAGVLAATLLAAWLVLRRAGAVVAPATLLRVLVALAAAVALGRLVVVRLPPLVALAAGLGLALVYLVVLALLREVGRADLRLVASVLGRKRAG